jgi:hypothetical protein
MLTERLQSTRLPNSTLRDAHDAGSSSRVIVALALCCDAQILRRRFLQSRPKTSLSAATGLWRRERLVLS